MLWGKFCIALGPLIGMPPCDMPLCIKSFQPVIQSSGLSEEASPSANKLSCCCHSFTNRRDSSSISSDCASSVLYLSVIIAVYILQTLLASQGEASTKLLMRRSISLAFSYKSVMHCTIRFCIRILI